MSNDIVQFLVKKIVTINLPDVKYDGMTDWFINSLQVGFRRMEWAQDAIDLLKTKYHQYNIDGFASTFISSDFECWGPNGIQLSQIKSL